MPFRVDVRRTEGVLPRLRKPTILPFQRLPAGIVTLRTRQNQLGLVQSLQTVLQNGTVFLFQYICADLDNVIRRYADNKGIVSGMMQLAQRQPIFDRGLSFGHIVWNDVGGIEQFACDKLPAAEKCPSRSLPQIRRFNCSIIIPSLSCRIWGRCPKDRGGSTPPS